MEKPESPSVSPSNPEIENRIRESIKDIDPKDFDGIQIHLPYAKDFLKSCELDVDESGFIVAEDSREYAVPWTFVGELVREYSMDEDETIFEAFFRPVTDERVYGWDRERLHLSDLHSVIRVDGKFHPVRYDSFNISEMHKRLETGFSVVMGWSNLLKEKSTYDEVRWFCFSRGFNDDLETLRLNCSNAKCCYEGSLSDWEGDTKIEPECPECDGSWDNKGITLCTICHSWYWGTNFSGDSIYAEPVCANCGADMEFLKDYSRYDGDKSYEDLVESERPNYTVYGTDQNGDIVYTFEHTDTLEEANKERDLAVDVSSVFEDVKNIEIRSRDEVNEVSQFVRED